MTPVEIRGCKVEPLDDIPGLAFEPGADAEAVRQQIEAFFSKLEEELGEER